MKGKRVAYAAQFLRSIGDYSYDTASRRAIVVAVAGEQYPGYLNYRGRPATVPDGFALVQWMDRQYPYTDEEGDRGAVVADLVNVKCIAVVGSARFAD